MFLRCSHDPFEALDRRWLRCEYLASQPGPRWQPSDDQWVRDGVRYARALRRCQTERQRCRLAEEMPGLHLAHALSRADPLLLRWAVEARLLAAEDSHSIARKCAPPGSAPGSAAPAERRRTTESLLRLFRGYGLIERTSRLGRVVHATRLTPEQARVLRQLGFSTPAQLLAQVLSPLPLG